MFSTNRTTLTHTHTHLHVQSLTHAKRAGEWEREGHAHCTLFLISRAHKRLLHLYLLDLYGCSFLCCSLFLPCSLSLSLPLSLCICCIWLLLIHFHFYSFCACCSFGICFTCCLRRLQLMLCMCVFCVCACMLYVCVTSFIELCLAAVTSMPTWFMLLLLPLALLLQALVLLQLFDVHLVVVVLLGGKINITFFFFGKCATQLFQLCCLLHLIALLLGQVNPKPKPQPQSSLTSCVIVRFTTLASAWKLMQLLAKRCKTLTCRSTGYKENWAMYCWALLATLILIIRHSTAYLQLFLQ